MNALLWQSILAFLALPGIVAYAVPLAMVLVGPARNFDPLGLIPFTAGCLLLAWCVHEFYVAGRGTLAPWAPPKHLVVSGPYRYSRNPMYLAVLLVLLGWAAMFHSAGLAVYALVIGAAFHLRVVYGEEPWLARTHGKEWATYSKQVHRWMGSE